MRWRPARKPLYGIADYPSAWPPGSSTQRGRRSACRGRWSCPKPDLEQHGELTRADGPRQHHPLLADPHGGFRVSTIYWEYKGGFFNAKGCPSRFADRPFPATVSGAAQLAEQRTPTSSISTKSTGRPLCRLGAAALFTEELRAAFRLHCVTKGGRHEHHRRDCNRDPALPLEIPEEQMDDLRRASRRRAAQQGARPRSVAGVQLATLPELARYWAPPTTGARPRPSSMRSRSSRPNRRGRSLHPRQVAA